MDNLSDYFSKSISKKGMNIVCRRIGKVVSIDIDISGLTLKEALGDIILPPEFRPTYSKVGLPIVSWVDLNRTFGVLEIYTDGSFVSYLWHHNDLRTFHFTTSFIV